MTLRKGRGGLYDNKEIEQIEESGVILLTILVTAQ